MSVSIKQLGFLALSLIALLIIALSLRSLPQQMLPRIAIANWGPHASLQDSIDGIKDKLKTLGLNENEQIIIEVMDVNFEPTLIMQMLAKLKASKPVVLVTLSTPVTQTAVGNIKDIPIVFADITDPVAVGILDNEQHAKNNITGASDRQNLVVFLQFAKKILPQAKKIGILYSTGEANDVALINMMQKAALQFNMEVVAVPIEQATDMPMRIQQFKDNVDFIYVGVSGQIQPSLPAIVSHANRMKIPVFNADANAVKNQQVLGSFGVSYYQVGTHSGELIFRLLQGEKIQTLAPFYPKASDHQGYISKKVADQLGITLPSNLDNVTIVE